MTFQHSRAFKTGFIIWVTSNYSLIFKVVISNKMKTRRREQWKEMLAMEQLFCGAAVSGVCNSI